MFTTLIGRTKNPYTGLANKQIEFVFDESSEYRITNIDGLGPVDASIGSFDTPLDPGGEFLASRQGNRNIVMTVEFNPKFGLSSTVTGLRNKLTEVFMPRNEVELEITVENRGTYFIQGRVETHVPTIFGKNPSVQISIICVDPFFRTDAGFIDLPYTEVGDNILYVNFPGLVDVGFRVEWKMSTNAPRARIYRAPYDGDHVMRIERSLLTNDQLKFSTVKGERGVDLVRSLATENTLGWFGGSLTNMRLFPGRNYFEFPDKDITYGLHFSAEVLYGGL